MIPTRLLLDAMEADQTNLVSNKIYFRCLSRFSLINTLLDCVGADYCYLPTSLNMDPSLIRSGPGACSPSSQCELCEGDCDKDEDCQENLICFHRHENAAVPGCRGGEYDRSRTYS